MTLSVKPDLILFSRLYSLPPCRSEVAGFLPLLGSGLRSSGLVGLSVPSGGALHARLQEGPGGQCPGGRLAGADCRLLPQRLVPGGFLRVLGHSERLVYHRTDRLKAQP